MFGSVVSCMYQWLLFSFLGWCPQREDHVTCSPDPLAPDQTKQTTLCVSYLLGE